MKNSKVFNIYFNEETINKLNIADEENEIVKLYYQAIKSSNYEMLEKTNELQPIMFNNICG